VFLEVGCNNYTLFVYNACINATASETIDTKAYRHRFKAA